MYLFHTRAESFKIEKFGVVGETRAHVIRALVFLFDEPKDITFSDKSLCIKYICISNKLKYLKSKAKKQKSSREVTLSF